MGCRDIRTSLQYGVGVLALAWLPGCGASPTGPTPPPPVSDQCRALDYPGATGGERIQHAIDDLHCRAVYIDDVSPDGAGVWRVPAGLSLRSGIVLEGPVASVAVLFGGTGNPILRVEGQSDVSIRRLSLQGSLSNGIRIDGSRRITVTQGAVTGSAATGIRITGAPSSDITIDQMTFSNNGGIDVRTDTADWNAYHAHVVVTNSSMTATLFGVALQNCGNSQATACEVRGNMIRPVADPGGSGIDLNRSHYAAVSGNAISGGGQGMTVDDTSYARITGNTVQASLGTGILVASGARLANRPWLITGNEIADNIVVNHRGFGLATYWVRNDPGDRNEFNTWRNNRIEGNVKGGCETNTDRNVFVGNGPQSCSPQNREPRAATPGTQ